MNNILKIFSVISYEFKIKIFFLLLLTLALTGLELLSIGSIPIFISTLIEKKNLFIKFDFLNSILENLNLIDLSCIIVTIFIIKNLFILFYNYYLFSLNFKMNIFFSKKIYYNYIFLEYLSLIKFKSSDMIRNLTGEVNNFVSCINNSIQIYSLIY